MSYAFTAVVLAAGAGTRIQSNTPKILLEVAKLPMIEHVLRAINNIPHIQQTITVLTKSLQTNPIINKLQNTYKFDIAIQHSPLGTGHALLSAFDIPILSEYTIVLFGDMPLIEMHILEQPIKDILAKDINAVILGFEAENPEGYGRIIAKQDLISDIIECKDANDSQKQISICNSGIMIVRTTALKEALTKVQPSIITKEFYLTQIIQHIDGICYLQKVHENYVRGVNNLEQLAIAENIMQNRIRKQMMYNGVQLLDPNSVFFSADTMIEPRVIIHPYVNFGRNVVVKSDTEIFSYSFIEGAHIGNNNKIGPFCYIRPDTSSGNQCKLGSFVEIKNTKIDHGSKIPHLSYIGDIDIGCEVNIGAGVVICNYNGIKKYRSSIAANAFIGSNSSIISPVNISSHTLVAAGSIINCDTNADDLAIARSKQHNIKNRGMFYRKNNK